MSKRNAWLVFDRETPFPSADHDQERSITTMFTISHLAGLVKGEVIGDGTVSITGVAAADSAGVGDLTFAEKETYFAAAEKSLATAVLVPAGFKSSEKILIQVKDPRVALAKVLPLFYPAESREPGI